MYVIMDLVDLNTIRSSFRFHFSLFPTECTCKPDFDEMKKEWLNIYTFIGHHKIRNKHENIKIIQILKTLQTLHF